MEMGESVKSLMSIILGLVAGLWGMELAAYAEPVEVPPGVLEGSPVLQRWQEDVPNVLQEIQTDPSLPTRLKAGYSQFPSSDHLGGFHVGLEDWWVGKTGLSMSLGYEGSFEGERSHLALDLHYHVLPLGGYFNLAPVFGYHHLGTPDYSRGGINLGLRLMLIPSRGGGTDLSLSQTFVNPGSGTEIGLTTLAMGYALTEQWRLGTEIEKQNSTERKDSRVGISLEWMF
ncbi:hypothetical protein [Roseofilum sp. SID1]|uniref:hypothetical protein n=1 Tax=Roseofilum sp. SID1 TaxID=2821497 RepID=UPI00298DB49B|nr:hypothetical protein [Roseofilum sp. SID1]